MSSPLRKLVEEMFQSLNLEYIDNQKLDLIARYVKLLLTGLNKARLTGEKSAEGIIWQQIYDSLYILKLSELEPDIKVLDLGSGGGLPGIPLKICRPEVELYLMDSSRKKTLFLKEAKEKLLLERTYILTGRAEDFGQDDNHREKYDLVLSKAVAAVSVLAELSLPLLKIGGRSLVYKGPRGIIETKEAEQAIKTCGGKLAGEWFYNLEGGENRIVYKINKVLPTPPKYPRRTGVPARNPI